MKNWRLQLLMIAIVLGMVVGATRRMEAKFYTAYISDSPTSTQLIGWPRMAGSLKYGLDLELIFISGSTRGIQSLIAGDVSFVGAIGTAVINGRLAGGDIAIVSSLTNTLPYYIIGKPTIKSPENLKGRTAAVHIPGTSADFALRLALTRAGLSYKDIKAVTVGGVPARIASVITGQRGLHHRAGRGKNRGGTGWPQGDYGFGQA